MNYIDIGVLAICGLGLILGFIGKASKKFFNLIFIIASVVGVYVFFWTIYDVLNGISGDLLKTIFKLPDGDSYTLISAITYKTALIIQDLTSKFNIGIESLIKLSSGIVSIILYILLVVLAYVILRVVGGFILRIFNRKESHSSARKTLGIFGLLKGAVIAVIVSIPIVTVQPILENMTVFNDSSFNQTVETQVSESKYLSIVEKDILKEFQLSFAYCNYTDSEGEHSEYVVNVCKSFAAALKLANIISSSSESSTNTILSIVVNMTPNEIAALSTSHVVCEIIEEVFGNAIDALKDTDLDMEKEVYCLQCIYNTLYFYGDGTNAFKEPEYINVESLAASLGNSEIIPVLSVISPGAFSSMDATTKLELSAELLVLKVNGTISLEKYTSLMTLVA